jgi:hypothetical protein
MTDRWDDEADRALESTAAAMWLNPTEWRACVEAVAAALRGAYAEGAQEIASILSSEAARVRNENVPGLMELGEVDEARARELATLYVDEALLAVRIRLAGDRLATDQPATPRDGGARERCGVCCGVVEILDGPGAAWKPCPACTETDGPSPAIGIDENGCSARTCRGCGCRFVDFGTKPECRGCAWWRQAGRGDDAEERSK